MMFKSLLTIFTIFTSTYVLESLAETPHGEPIVLTNANFDLETSDYVWLVKFYAPWCKHCKELSPVMKELAANEQFPDTARVGLVDCTRETDICLRFGVRSYPTIAIVTDDHIFRYNGAREFQPLLDFTQDGYATMGVAEPVVSFEEFNERRMRANQEFEKLQRESEVVPITSDNFDEIIANSNTPWILKFYSPSCGHCKRLAPTWIRLSIEMKASNSGVSVGKVDCSVSHRLCSRFHVNRYPGLFYYTDGLIYTYEGERSLEDLKIFATDGWRNAETVKPISEPRLFAKVIEGSESWFRDNPNAAMYLTISFLALFLLGMVYRSRNGEVMLPPSVMLADAIENKTKSKKE